MTLTTPHDAPAIHLARVARVFPARRRTPARAALADVSLEVRVGEWAALLGPNGSGKSTLLRLLSASDASTSGEVRVLGVDPRLRARRVRASVGVVFQSPGLDALLTVRENLALQGALHGMAGPETRSSIVSLARDFGFEDRLDDRVASLSGGLCRRVDLARALLPSPSLLLVDEPTAGLDPGARASFLDLLRSRRERSTMAILMSTHLMDEAEHADRVVMLDAGRVVADGAPAALRSRLGPAAIRAASTCEDVLRHAGLEVFVDAGGATGAGDAEAITRAATALTGQGTPFAFGPPSLDDVYRSLTGRSLTMSEGR